MRWVFAVPNGFYSSPAQKAKMRQEGLKSGVWDIFYPLPMGEYHGLFIEMKYGSNKLTPEQVEFGDVMKARGYLCQVAYRWQDAYQYLIEYAGLKKQ